MNQSKDDPRDAHLLAALRHAPDRDATPPREVSERILAAARAAAQSSRTAALPSREVRAPWWHRLSAWLTQPQVAASFGTLVVASLVGMMWSTREPPVPEFTPSPPATADRAQQAPIAEAPAAAPPAAAVTPEAKAAATAPAAAARSDTAAAPRPKRASDRDAAVRGERPRATAGAAAAAADKAAAPAAVLPSSPAAAPAPQVAAAEAPAPAAAGRRSAPLNDSQALEQRREAAPRPASGAALGMALAAKAQAVADPLASLDQRLAPSPEQVSWAGAGRRWAHQTPQVAWWSRFKQGTAGVWQAQPRGPSAAPPWLALSMAGTAVATIDLVDDGVLFCPAEGATCWRAPITPAQREAWTAEVARW